ncbi:MAG: SDR family oxidoreductase [Candidatus Dormibacteria bacterium]
MSPVPAWSGVRDKRVLVTGGTGGIGLAGASVLAALGAELVLVARSEARAGAAVDQIRRSAGEHARVEVLMADLESLASVRRLAAEVLERYPRLEVLVNNAGAMFTSRQFTADGFERTWALNHLAPFLLTTLLLERIIASAPARIVTTSSDAHLRAAGIPLDDLRSERGYGARGFQRYGETKLANVMFTRALARRLPVGVTANCFHPGLVATGFNRNNGWLMEVPMLLLRPFSRTPARGAETLVWLCDSPDASEESGGYFVDQRRRDPSRAARDEEAAERLWSLSAEQTAGAK